MANILITGGTGLIGKHLTKIIGEQQPEDTVIILTRNPGKYVSTPKLQYAHWNIEKGEIDKEAIQKTDAVIHLAGAGIAEKRWTTTRKREILDSRTQSSTLLVQAIRENGQRIRTVVSASGIGYYGADHPQYPQPFKETDAPSDDFLAGVCIAWERSMQPVSDLGKRLVILRTGLALSASGGTLAAFIQPLKYKIATIIGKGQQVYSWVSLDDLCRMYLYALGNEHFSGIYNAVAPQPLTQKELVLKLARRRTRHFLKLPVPKWLLQLILGEMSTEVLKSTTVSADKILQAGFLFGASNMDTFLGNVCVED